MADPAAAEGEGAVSFGPFRLLPQQRLLLESDKPVRLGSRALDILIALVERPGEVVGKDELMARVWPNTHVDEGNLKFQIGALRRALGGGNRYLANVPGRGYSFTAPVTRLDSPMPAAPQVAHEKPVHNLPARLMRIIGRADIVSRLAARLPRQRLITIVGPGGIGKTTVALAVAEALIPAYEHGVWLIDLAPLGDPRLVPNALFAALGLEIRSENPLLGLIAFLRDKRMLLVFDNCAHVIDAAAALAIAVLRNAPGVHILATSREPLRIEGEHMHRLSPLASPPASARLTAVEALRFPAVQLFVERAEETLDEFTLSDADASLVSGICNKLDGIALAIELAAARVDAFGVRGGGSAPRRSVSAADQRPPHGPAPASDPERDARLELWPADRVRADSFASLGGLCSRIHAPRRRRHRCRCNAPRKRNYRPGRGTCCEVAGHCGCG